MLQDSGATQGTQRSMVSDKQLLPVSAEKATADVSWHGVMFTYHGVMSLFHSENEAMARGTRVMLFVLSWNDRIAELERFLDYEAQAFIRSQNQT